MKIAICLSGYVGWTDGPYPATGKIEDLSHRPEADLDISFNSIKSKIIDMNEDSNVDFFIHTWSSNRKNELDDLYSPKIITAETQDSFNNGELIGFGKGYKPGMIYDNTFRCYSKWNTQYKVLKTLREYEEKNEFEYDCVLSTRIDIVFMSNLIFKDYDLNTMWVAGKNFHRTYIGRRYSDIMFFSNSSIMNGFVSHYKNINKYSQQIYKSRVPTDTHALVKAYIDDFSPKTDFFFDEQTDYHSVRGYLTK